LNDAAHFYPDIVNLSFFFFKVRRKFDDAAIFSYNVNFSNDLSYDYVSVCIKD
jgi:hypothetical protein